MQERIAKLCRLCGMGEITSQPVPVSGGYLHRMFRMETVRGVFAVKALNPDIMTRPEALENMRNGERVNAEFGMQNAEFEVCPSLGGVAEVDGTYFIAYEWVDGAAVYPPEITVEHCRIMGGVLGDIHSSGLEIPGMEPCSTLRQPFDWSLLADDRLPRWDAEALEGLRRLQEVQVISHRDLDPKNVMWQGMRPCIIDWEAAGYVNPWQELIELLNYWADDEPRARAMIAAYGQRVELAHADWDAALSAGMDGMLGWLHYNLRRAAGLEGSSPRDREAGEQQTRATLAELEKYEERIRFLRRLLP